MTREEVIESLENIKYINAYHRCREGIAIDMVIETLQEPEIVHCKDCKYWMRTRNKCGLAGYLISERGYCLYGKKAGEQE